jgi:glycosyltransferase involved in cell wall biosynthesis
MKVSIITVCKNSEEYIERSINSVLNQTYNDIEYLIIDGKSIDGTLPIIDKYKDKIDVLISESDTGIYNAMNKGVEHSTGDVIYFLNSDDLLYDRDVISDIASAFVKYRRAMIVYGNVIMTDDKKRELVKYNDINKKFFYKNTICHQALFARSVLFNEIGFFDEKYKIHADVDWIMRVYFNKANVFKYVNRNICYFSAFGFCSNPINAERYKFDRQEISAKYFLKARYRLYIKKILMQLGVKFTF